MAMTEDKIKKQELINGIHKICKTERKLFKVNLTESEGSVEQ